MVDRIRPLKLENPATGGTDEDLFPTGMNPNEDHVTLRGILFQSDSSDDESVAITRNVSNKMTFIDVDNTTPVTLSDLMAGSEDLTEGDHEVLDTLMHLVAEDCHEQITRISGRISNVTVWTDTDETTKIRELQITRSDNLVSQLVLIQYNSSGEEKMRITGTITRSGGRVDSIDWVELVA